MSRYGLQTSTLITICETMMPATTQEHRSISQALLKGHENLTAFFRNNYDPTFKVKSATHQDFSPLGTHQHVPYVIQLLQNNPDITKEEIIVSLQNNPAVITNVDNIDNIQGIVISAVQTMVMVDPIATNWYPADFILGEHRPIAWLSQEPFKSFIKRSFPKHPFGGSQAVVTERSQLKAWKLQNRGGITLYPTSNLSEHLLLDTKNNFLYLFHNVSYLKEHLTRYRNDPTPLEITFKDSLERGTLPPQLLVETLHSLQAILFPPLDQKSGNVLETLVRKEGFDPECARYGGYKIFPEPPEGFNYVYWGKRIEQLNDLAQRRPPRNKLERWFEQKTTERNALFIALLALFISIFVGILSIILGCVQVWVAWMAWKYPVQGAA